MPRQQEFSAAQVAQALLDSRGRRHQAGRILGCSSRTIFNYIQRYPELAELSDDLKGQRVDEAELALDAAVAAGAPWAIILTLRTLGRDRGYTERLDHNHQFSGPLEVQIVQYGCEPAT